MFNIIYKIIPTFIIDIIKRNNYMTRILLAFHLSLYCCPFNDPVSADWVMQYRENVLCCASYGPYICTGVKSAGRLTSRREDIIGFTEN